MRHVRSVALCSFMLVVTACGAKGTFVVVHVDSTVQASIHSIQLQLMLAGKSATTTLANQAGGDLTFPTDAVLDIHSGAGTLDVTAVALDAAGSEVARATASATVQRDETTSLTLVFAGNGGDDMTMPQPDLAGSNLAFSDTSHDYGTVVTGTSSPFTFTLTNTGAATTSALTATIGGSDSVSFALMTDTCTGVTLPSLGTCTVTVSFAPTTVGAKSAALTITGGASDVAVATLSGTAVAPAALSIAPPSGHAFAGYLPGQSSTPFTFTVTNGGGVTSGALTVAVTGSMAGEFAVSNNSCDSMMLPANGTGSCTFDVVFTPAAPGARSASVTVTGNPGGTAVAAVSGTGLKPANLVIHGGLTSHDFAIVAPGSVSSLFTIQIDNTGDVSSGIPTPSLAGANSGEFAYASHCAAAIPAGGSCTVDLAFSPSSGGSKTATFSLTATPGGTVSFMVSGQAPPVAPTGVVSCPGDGRLKVYFTGSAGATSYNLYISTSSPVNRSTATKLANIGPGVNASCSNGSICYAVVSAVNAYGESPNSSEVSGVAAAGPSNLVVAGAYSANVIDIFDNYSALAASTTGAARQLSGAAVGLSNPTSVLVDKAFNDLYVASRGNATVRIWHDAATVTGNVAPTRTLTSVVYPEYVAMDFPRDRLYVNDQGVLKIWNRACTLNGNVAPDATVTLSGGPAFEEIYLDTATDMLYTASNSTFRGIAVIHQASTLTGTVTKAANRTINVMGEPTNPTYFGVSVDETNDMLFVGINDGAAYGLVNASTISGVTAASTTATGPTPYVHAAAGVMMDFTDCSNTIKAWSPDNAMPTAPTKQMTSSSASPCYESVWYQP